MTEIPSDLKRAVAGRYTLDRVLGSGGMATVYLGRDLKHDRQVAVKVMRHEVAEVLGVERFLREIAISSKLSHPHIVPVYDSGQLGGILYYTMPYVEGESLRRRMNCDGRITLDEALRITREVAAALSYAHGQGVVHRDIKPENVLFSGGVAVVADFGIARAVSAAGGKGLTTSGFPLGTLGYMSPEQAAGSHNLDGRSDIYSLGCVLYEMLVGKPPERWLTDTALTTGRITDAAPEERVHLDSLPEAVERILIKALAQAPEQRFATADELASAIATPPEGVLSTPLPTIARQPRGRHVPRSLAIGTLAALAAIALVFFGVRWRSHTELDPNVIAVAPFDVLGPELGVWREGLVDILSASLDGAGPLSTIAPSVVINRWEGRADAVSAASLGSNLGAGLVLYGRLVGAGADSARAVASLYDVQNRRTVMEFDLRDRADRVDRLADSMAVGLMGELARTRGLSGWRLRSLGSSSPAALKAFLQGERHYRSFDLDSAESYYRRAIELDSTFALAYSRLPNTVGWTDVNDPSITPWWLRAGELNHGLARRESLLVAADSIRGAVNQFIGDSTSWELLRRLLTTLRFATQQYPLDPQVWYELGEAQYHQGPYVGVTDQMAYESFTRAVTLDSAFVPAYRHLIELSLLLDGRAQALRVTEEYVRRADSSLFRDAARVTAALLDPERATDSATQEMLDALPVQGIHQTAFDLKWWADSAETSVRLARALFAASDSTSGRQLLTVSLAYRGHLRGARELIGTQEPALVGVLARLGGLPRDTADAMFQRWLDAGDGFAIFNGLRWWAQERDTVSIQRAIARWDSLNNEVPPEYVPRNQDVIKTARAYLALARADTLRALAILEEIPNWPNRYYSYYEQLTRAEILARRGRDSEAAYLLDHMPFPRLYLPSADAVVVALERGRVHERLGNRDVAIQAYGQVVNTWYDADPELQPFVDEARQALVRLAAEPRGR